MATRRELATSASSIEPSPLRYVEPSWHEIQAFPTAIVSTHVQRKPPSVSSMVWTVSQSTISAVITWLARLTCSLECPRSRDVSPVPAMTSSSVAAVRRKMWVVNFPTSIRASFKAGSLSSTNLRSNRSTLLTLRGRDGRGRRIRRYVNVVSAQSAHHCQLPRGERRFLLRQQWQCAGIAGGVKSEHDVTNPGRADLREHVACFTSR